MKTLTIEQFRDLVKSAAISNGWNIEDQNEIIVDEDFDHETGTRTEITDTYETGWYWNTIEAAGLKLDRIYSLQYKTGRLSTPEIYADHGGDTEKWHTLDFAVIDEDGDELEKWQLLEIIDEERSEFDQTPDSLGEDQTEKIDTENDMETTIVKRDNALDLEFCGELVASASSSPNNAHPDYSHSVGRWTELELYRTQGGKYVCSEVGCTQHQGEHTRYSAEVHATKEGVIGFFGTGWLAKELYESAGIEAVEVVE